MSSKERKYSAELGGYQSLIKTKDREIINHQISDIKSDLEQSRLSHSTMEKVLDDARVQYSKVFDEKETLMLVGI